MSLRRRKNDKNVKMKGELARIVMRTIHLVHYSRMSVIRTQWDQRVSR